MARSNRIEEERLRHLDTLPREAGSVQRAETEKSFMAGAGAALHLVDIATDLPEEEGAAMLESMHREMRNYAEGLRTITCTKCGRSMDRNAAVGWAEDTFANTVTCDRHGDSGPAIV